MSSDFFATAQASIYRDPKWAFSAMGIPIELYASQTLAALSSLQPILLMGGIHGDEPEGIRLAGDTLRWLLSTGDTVAPWALIRCLNVDGAATNTRVNGHGVDLNRNYPSKDWSPVFEKDRYFPGRKSASEPEIRAVVKLLEQLQPRLIIHCHSWKPCIVAAGEKAVEDAARLGQSSGYQVVPEIGYPTPGSLSSYGWHDLGIPVICIEEVDGLKDSDLIWPHFASGMRAVFTDLSLRGARAKSK